MTAFVDTSFFIAVVMQRDQWHERAVESLRSETMSLVTSSLVINETITLLQARGYFSAALKFLRRTRRSDDLRILYPDASVQAGAWEEAANWGAKGANAVDCVSFVLMKEQSIRQALTFDRQFRLAGFEVAP